MTLYAWGCPEGHVTLVMKTDKPEYCPVCSSTMLAQAGTLETDHE